MSLRRKRRGFTLIEMLACIVFLGVTVYPILGCITQSQARELNAQDQMTVLGLIQDQIEGQRAIAYTTALTTGTTNTTPTPTGMTATVTLSRVITLVSGYTDLYQVQVTGTWTNTAVPNRNGSITLTTMMRAPHV
jgi:prepilin-type N-terminal cleavage/methylation domain-containing protein